MILAALALATVSGCTVTDGDTIRCGDERIRLLGIDAPEMPGHCRKGRKCAPGDPQAAKASLKAAVHGPLRIDRISTDRYGRTVAVVYSGRINLSCLQLRKGHGVYMKRWDNDERIGRECSP